MANVFLCMIWVTSIGSRSELIALFVRVVQANAFVQGALRLRGSMNQPFMWGRGAVPLSFHCLNTRSYKFSSRPC